MTAADQNAKQNEAHNVSAKTTSAGAAAAAAGTPKSTPQRVTINAPYAYEELAVSSPSDRNWRGIFIALLVIVAVLGLIVFSIVLVSPPEEGPRVKGRKPTLKDIFLDLPPPARFNGTWISDTEFVYQDRYGGVTLYNAENLTTEVLVTNVTFRQYNTVDFKISNDLKYVLLITDVVKLYEHTKLARYHIYDRSTGFRKPLSPNETDVNAPHLQYAAWSPNESAIAFVYENDVYYKPFMQKELVCRITSNGPLNGVFSGIPDWLYETQLLHTDHVLWFSPDGQNLLYLSFNDAGVEDYKYPWYDSKNSQEKYPKIRAVKYPQAGTNNPIASVWIVKLKKSLKKISAFEIKPTSSVENGSYITSARFYNDNDVSVVWLNRRQNTSVILQCRAQDNYNCTNFHIEKASCDKDNCGWTEPIFNPLFARSGNQSLIRCPVKDGNNGDFMHVCQIVLKNAVPVVPLTHGAFEVTRIIGWDEENHLIYAIATNEENPGVRHLFKIGDMNSTQAWTCLTCQPKVDLNLTVFDGDVMNETLLNDTMLLYYKCDYNNVVFSRNFRYYVQECLGPDIPVLFLVETATNYRMMILDSSAALRAKVRNLSKPRIKKFHVDIDDGDETYKAQVMLHLPPVLREYEDVAFPLILIVDSMPGSQSVSERWELSWPWFLASTRSYIVAHIDVRGSGYQGEKMRREIFKKIGQIEVQDQLAVLTYFRDNFNKFIDRDKICAVGSGYGGYVAAMLLLQDVQQVLNCSISISPITNWLYYNSYFTERYFGLPSEQLMQYQNADLADVIKRVGNLNDRNYLLVHGTADTTVNPQHSMMFAKSMIEKGILFQQVVYPDENHAFGAKARIHLYKEIDLFFNESFGPPMDEWHDESDDFFLSASLT